MPRSEIAVLCDNSVFSFFKYFIMLSIVAALVCIVRVVSVYVCVF